MAGAKIRALITLVPWVSKPVFRPIEPLTLETGVIHHGDRIPPPNTYTHERSFKP